MSTVVAVMDRGSFGANTDVLVFVEPLRRRLLWVPRDLWSEGLSDRVNRAYATGGPGRLLRVLAEHGLEAEHVLCLLPEAIEAGLRGVTVTVPVREPLEFWYPLHPASPIEEGRKRVRFEPPAERLAGERIHQWIGARYRVTGPGSDLERIERQQQLVAVLLGEGFGFSRFLDVASARRLTSQAALADLGQVRADWSLVLLDDVEPETIDGKDVLVRD